MKAPAPSSSPADLLLPAFGAAAVPPIVGGKHVRGVQKFLNELHARYGHPNRVLFHDHVLVAYLLAFFNPAVRSLRAIEDMSRTPGFRRHVAVPAVCRSTLSDANALFDPAHLEGLIDHLRGRLPQLARQEPQLEQLLKQLVALDGSFFRVAADVQWALRHRKGNTRHRFVRLNCAFCQATGVPLGVSVSGDDGRGEGAAAVALLARERAAVAEAGGGPPIYLFDSGVVSFALLESLLKDGEEFLCNLRKEVGLLVEKELPLSEKDRAAGVVSDRLVRLKGSPGHTPPEGLLREVIIPYTDRHGRPQRVRLLTSLPDLPAHLIGVLYRYRWQIELFFRWLKVHANFRHLTSHSVRGVTTGFYVAVIGAMLLCIHTGQGLNKYALNLLGAVSSGLASLDETLPIYQRRMRERQLDKDRLARKRAQKAGV
jgi:hypothetical protein